MADGKGGGVGALGVGLVRFLSFLLLGRRV